MATLGSCLPTKKFDLYFYPTLRDLSTYKRRQNRLQSYQILPEARRATNSFIQSCRQRSTKQRRGVYVLRGKKSVMGREPPVDTTVLRCFPLGKSLFCCSSADSVSHTSAASFMLSKTCHSTTQSGSIPIARSPSSSSWRHSAAVAGVVC